MQNLRVVVAPAGIAAMLLAGVPAMAQKTGGVLTLYLADSPANMSMLESPAPSSEMLLMACSTT
jgi:hypothetical protein